MSAHSSICLIMSAIPRKGNRKYFRPGWPPLKRSGCPPLVLRAGPSESGDSLIWVKAGRPDAGDLTGMSEQPLMDVAQTKILSLADETQYAPDGIVSRTLLRTDGLRVVLFGFAEGQDLTEHTSTQTALVQILTGECEFILAGQSHLLKSGDLIYLPPLVPHALRATRQFSMLLTLSRTESAARLSTTTQTTP